MLFSTWRIHTCTKQQFEIWLLKKQTSTKEFCDSKQVKGGAHIVNDQFFFTVLPSELPDAHLDEILESGVHVDVLILQLAVTGPELDLLHKP